MDDDISGILRMEELGGDYSQTSGCSSVTPIHDPDNPIEFETDDNGTKEGRKNFTVDEDLLLVSAWLNTSIDPIHGTNQKACRYWSKIGAYWKEYSAGKCMARSNKSLQNRWSIIQLAVNKFCGCLIQAELGATSGLTQQDLIDKAKTLYRTQVKCAFKYEHCWNKLKHHVKWMKYVSQGSSKRKTSSHDTINLDDGENTSGDFSNLVRPPGNQQSKGVPGEGPKKKKGKVGDTSQFDLTFNKWTEGKNKNDDVKMQFARERFETQKSNFERQMEMQKIKLEIDMKRAEVDQRRAEAEHARAKAEQDKENVNRTKEETAIMMMDLNSLSDYQQEYFKGLQADILSRRGFNR